MKKILNFLLISTLIFTYSCEDDIVDPTDDVQEAGVIVEVTPYSNGRILGSPNLPSDLSSSDISFANVDLDLNFARRFGGQNVDVYEVTKSYNGEEPVVIATSNELPINITYSNIEDYTNGTSVTDITNLRVGDTFTFQVRFIGLNGEFAYPVDGNYTVVVNCSSALAGFYAVTVVRDDGATWDQGIEEIVEVSPGLYKTVTTGGWAAGAIAPDQGFNFSDTCGTLSVPDQDLAQAFYSNDVKQEDGANIVSANGDLSITYSIDFSSGPSTYTNTYIKQ